MRKVLDTGVITKGLRIALAVTVGFVVLLCLVPPISRDALIHHLAVPKLYLEAGSIVELPDVPWSYYPMNLQILYWGCLWLGSDILPKFVHFAFGLGTAMLISGYLHKKLGGAWGLAGALLFLTIPIVLKLSTTVYVDLGLAFFSLGATLTLFRVRDAEFARWRGVIWAGLLCGLGMGVKYNGFLVFLLLAALVPISELSTAPNEKYRLVKAIGTAALFVVVALLAYAPNGVRNAIWTSNPIYPLYDGFVQQTVGLIGHNSTEAVPANPAVSASENLTESLGPLQRRRLVHEESALDISLLPARIFFQGVDGDLRLFDGRLSPLLIFFLPLVLWWRKLPSGWRGDIGSLLFIAWAYIVLAFILAPVRVRYLIPVVPHLVILSVYGVKYSIDLLKLAERPTVKKCGLAALATFIGYGVWVSTAYAVDLFRYVAPLDYVSGKVDRDEYISRYRDEYPALQYVNQVLDDSARLYFVYLGQRGYYCDVPYVPDSNNNHLLEILYAGNALRDPQEMSAFLKGQGITHLVIDMEIAWDTLLISNGNLFEAQILDDFLATETSQLFGSNGVYVFELEQESLFIVN